MKIPRTQFKKGIEAIAGKVIAHLFLCQRSGLMPQGGTSLEGVLDMAIVNGKVAEVARDINFSHAQECFDVKDFCVVPGIIDLHVHASSWLGGRCSHKMMTEAFVTTALDMAGPIESVRILPEIMV